MAALVFIPVDGATLGAWATTGLLPGTRRGFAVTPAMAAAFDFSATTDEDAEHTALCIASLAALIQAGRRLVAVAETGCSDDQSAPEFGSVSVSDVPFGRVTSLFAGAEARTPDGVLGLPLPSAWERDDVQNLLSRGDLLWHGAGEWQLLTGRETA
ncbi:MAG: hypothetical protein WCF12_11660 [Propionicimonas sp.]